MMKIRILAMILTVAVGSAVPAAVGAQILTDATGQWVAPRTEHGHPDLQGNWSNATLTPLERPAGQPPVLSAEEVARIEGGVQTMREDAALPSDPNRPAPQAGGDNSNITQSVLTPSFIAAGGGTGGYNFVYIEPGERVAVVNGEPRSSLITFPENGRMPAVTPLAQQWRAEQAAARQQFGQYDHPEVRSVGDRCIMSFGRNAGPPMLPNGFYNNNYTIVQTPDHVAIMTEMIHDTRIIRIGEGPRLPADVRPYFGDSWAHWEDDTLVIETTNIHPAQPLRGAPSENLRIIERLTRVDEETILYRFTVDDPTSFEAPWTAELPFTKLDGLLYEYACHEGNYALSNVLSGARYQERREEENQSEPR